MNLGKAFDKLTQLARTKIREPSRRHNNMTKSKIQHNFEDNIRLGRDY